MFLRPADPAFLALGTAAPAHWTRNAPRLVFPIQRMDTNQIGLALTGIVLILTVINLAILGLAVKLYTDQTKQRILRGDK